MRTNYYKAPHKYKKGDRIYLSDMKRYVGEVWQNSFQIGMTGTIRYRNHYNSYDKPLPPNYEPSYSVDWDEGLSDWWIGETMIKKVGE